MKVLDANITEGKQGNFERKLPKEVLYFGPYDYGSVMHYGTDYFGRKQGGPFAKKMTTIEPRKCRTPVCINLK